MVTRLKAVGGLGLRRLDVMNKACILKPGRKIQSGAIDFWCAVMKGKYKRGSDEGVVLARANDSHLWKSIVRLWPQLDTHSWWTIGDGKIINLCHDAWIEEGLRLADCITQIPDNMRSMKLVHIVKDGDWDWNMLNTWVPLYIQQKIGALLPPRDNNGNDNQLCKENAGGIFSIARMYHALCDYDLNNNDKVWNCIWRLKVPERVRTFVWMVKHGRLLTNERKHRMGLGSEMCDFCRDHKDTTLHALRDCVLVRPLWLSVVDASLRHEFFTTNLDEWIEMNVRTNGGKNNYEDWSNYWALACHCAWTWKNKEKYDADFFRPTKQTEFVRQRMKMYKLAGVVMHDGLQQQQAVIHVGWKPPLNGWVCLNVDGACKDGVIGCGGVIRGNSGEWLHGFSKLIGRGEAYTAELWGVLEGIRLARRLKFTRMEVRVDSVEVVEDIMHNRASKGCGKALIRSISELLKEDWEVSITHSFREANNLADALANYSFSTKDKFCIYQDCPDYCKHLLDADEKGVTTPRSVSL
jgi:ribonuclease HI